MKYIDAEKLKAEIERQESEIKSQIAELGNFESNEIGLFNYLDLYDDILSFITSLQHEQPDVDLEKEINIEISKWTCYEEIGFGARYDAKPFDGRDIEKIARHFYELGLNARKEE